MRACWRNGAASAWRKASIVRFVAREAADDPACNRGPHGRCGSTRSSGNSGRVAGGAARCAGKTWPAGWSAAIRLRSVRPAARRGRPAEGNGGARTPGFWALRFLACRTCGQLRRGAHAPGSTTYDATGRLAVIGHAGRTCRGAGLIGAELRDPEQFAPKSRDGPAPLGSSSGIAHMVGRAPPRWRGPEPRAAPVRMTREGFERTQSPRARNRRLRSRGKDNMATFHAPP
jgi:hypothetical protein